MRGDLGPPGGRGAPGEFPRGHHHQRWPLITKNQHPRFNHPGSYGCAWRQGFAFGFRDALRLAAREVDDPAVWLVLSRLADEYELAGGDD
jgi:hypothetical protein